MSGSFPYADVARRLPRLLAAGQQEAARRGHSVLVSVTVDIPPVEPAVLFSRTPSQERILWEQPNQKLAMVAFGAATRLISHGAQRFSQISADWRGLLSHALVDAASSYPLPAPISLGGFAFDPARQADSGWEEYPDALLVIPRLLFSSCAGSSWLTINVLVASDCNRQAAADAVVDSLCTLQREEEAVLEEESSGCVEVQQDETQTVRWKEKVSAIIKEIESGALEKLVLARSVHAHSPRLLNPGAVIQNLRCGYHHCTLFAFASRQRCFIGERHQNDWFAWRTETYGSTVLPAQQGEGLLTMKIGYSARYCSPIAKSNVSTR